MGQTYSYVELYKAETKKLKLIASSLGIPIPLESDRFDIIDLIRLFPGDLTDAMITGTELPHQRSVVPTVEQASETAPEIQKYSLRIQRIRDSQQ